MSIISTEREFPYSSVRSTALLHTSLSGRHLGSAWPQTCSVLITRPYHWPGTQLNLTAGPATDLRGYEPNEPAHWWDGFRQAIPESPWGALPQSHSSPPSAAFAFSISFILLSGICLWKKPSWFCCLYTYSHHLFVSLYAYLGRALYHPVCVCSHSHVSDIGWDFWLNRVQPC